MKHSLKGLRVLNTRPKGQASALSEHIRTAGGLVIELPTLEIHPTYEWVGSLPDLKTVTQAIFISINAVEHCFQTLIKQNINWPQNIKVIALGKATAAALNEYKIPVHALPEIADSEHLLKLPILQEPKYQYILLFKGEGGRPLIEQSLLEKGANLLSVPVYRRALPKIDHEFIRSLWHDDAVDIILLTSEQSLQHLFKLFDKEAHDWLRSKTFLVISQRLAETASLAGIKKIIPSHPDRILKDLLGSIIKE